MTKANDNHAKASDRWIVRVYFEGAGEPQVYENVKHVWWSAGNTVLTLLHYYDDGSWRYVNWPREQVWYYTRTLDTEVTTKPLAHMAYMGVPGREEICYCAVGHSHGGAGLVS